MSERKVKFMDVARKYARAHLPVSYWTDLDVKALAYLLRRMWDKGYSKGFNAGYSRGSDDQMKMRILDAQERKARP